MPIEISLKKSTTNPTSASGLTLAEPVFNHSNNTLWIGKGSGNSPVWVGAGVCGASGGIAAGLTTQLPTHAAVKNYFDAVSSSFLGATASYVATFNGATGAVTGVSSFNGLTGAVGGVTTSVANTFTALQSFNAGISASSLYVSGGITSSPYSFVDGIPLNPVVLDSAKIQLGDLNGAGENVKLIIDNYEGNNIRAYGTFRVYNDLYSNNIYSDWIRPSSGLSIKIGNDGSSIVIGDDGVVNNTKIVIHDPTQTLNVVNANGIINIGDVNNVGNSTKLIVDDTTNTVTINGNLTVSGGITATFSENVLIEDNIITLNSNVTGTPTENAGIEIERGTSANTQILWNESTDKWTFTNNGTLYYDIPTDYVSSFNGLTGAVGGVTTSVANTFTALNSFNAGISAAGATLSGTVTAPTPSVGTNNTQVATTAFVQNEIVADTVTTFNGRTGAVQGVSAAVAGTGISVSGATGAVTITNIGVQSFNGRTGAVQGVSSAAAGTGISISAATGAITITNTGVQSFNGLTGAVTGVTVGGANTFTALNSFNAGISAAGITVASKLFLGQENGIGAIKTLPDDTNGTLYVYMPNGRIGDINNHWGNGLQIGMFGDESRIYIGDVQGVANNTTVEINDATGTISLSGAVSATSLSSSGNLTTTGDVYFGGASASLSSQSITLGTTFANQNIASVQINDGAVDINRTVEFFVQASHSSGYEALKIMVIHDGTNTYNTQYGLIRTGSSLCSSYTTTTANQGTLLRLLVTPTNTNTTFTVVRTVIPA